MAKIFKVIDEAIQHYAVAMSVRDNPALQALAQETAITAPCAAQITAPEQAQLLQFFIRLIEAKNVLEIGVFTGHATLAMAQALPPQGHIIACDISPEWQTIAQKHWQQAGVENKITFRLGPAQQTLQALLSSDPASSFDLIFIDANKSAYDEYYHLSFELLRPGGLIILDNVLWAGTHFVGDADTPGTQTIHQLLHRLKADPSVEVSLLTMAQGMLLVRKNVPSTS